ncbi:hypothetical protein [Bacillus mobilis]|uniref:hypothetical protein n=1 Tax=Bacillus mobilis TaxID=2026190 RepID=UPI002E24E5A3|nr:hypothetical protein [Bacillus mobilis]
MWETNALIHEVKFLKKVNESTKTIIGGKSFNDGTLLAWEYEAYDDETVTMKLIKEIKFSEKEVELEVFKQDSVVQEITSFVRNYTKTNRLAILVFDEEKTYGFESELTQHYEGGKKLSIGIPGELKKLLPEKIQANFIQQAKSEKPINMFLFDPNLLEPITTVSANLITIFGALFAAVKFSKERQSVTNDAQQIENTNEKTDYIIIGDVKIPTNGLSEETIKELCLEAIRRQ